MNKVDSLFPVEASILSSDAINEILASEYSAKHKIVGCRLYYRSIHDTYLVISDKVNLYLKVYRYGLRTKEEIQSEIDLLIHLSNCGIRTTEPIIKNDGSFIIEFNTVQGTRYGVLYTSVGLKSFTEVNETDLLNEKLGEYISRIHSAWDNLEAKKNRWELDTVSFIDNAMKYIRDYANWYTFDVAFIEQVAAKTKSKISGLSRKNPTYGICHGDIFSGNIRLDINDNPVLFDFDFCGYGWRMYDISLYLSPFGWGCDA